MSIAPVQPPRTDPGPTGAPHRGAAPPCAAFARIVGAGGCSERSWSLGGTGVDAVTARLARLGDRWRVLHGVPLGPAGTVDQLVVGPGGVHAVLVRHRPGAAVWVGGGTVLVNGARAPWVDEARQLARQASARLRGATGRPVAVTALVVVVGAHDGFVVQQQPEADVHVLTRRDVDGWLRTRADVLDDAAVGEVFAAARLTGTWDG